MSTANRDFESRGPDRWVSHRFGGVVILTVVFVAFAVMTRILLSATAWEDVSIGGSYAAAWLIGLGFDLLTAALCAIPLALYLTLVPQRMFTSRLHRMAMTGFVAVVVFVLTFIATAEWTFWHELEARFNFIAVDYLLYTTEVVGNIRESYPMPAILTGQAMLTAAIMLGLRRMGWLDAWLTSATSLRKRLIAGGLIVAAPLLALSFVSQSDIPDLGNERHTELAKDGVFSFFAAWKSRELDYGAFYPTMDQTAALSRARRLVATPETTFRSEDLRDFVHTVTHPGPERRMNVIQITVESLSTFYLGAFGDSRGLTPNLDRLASEGILFTRTFATGTRTTRGMEAITLSIPPTPGRSILHRQQYADLFNIGSVFREHGYETVFLYGGFGAFDNMNGFFEGNGFRIVDRGAVEESDITFANAWGACDEDLYDWTIREADRLHERGKPFYFFVMTTSNHRPYTFPEGKIDLPQGKRNSAVKYSDYAIGQFVRKASTRPWFDDTILVVVADHTSSSAGKAEIDIRRYRIPMMIRAPKIITEPRSVDTLCSQIDLGPTLFSLLGWSWTGTFFGRDVLSMPAEEGRAFIGNYQKLSLFRDDHVVILRPTGTASFYGCDPWGEDLHPLPDRDEDLFDDAVAVYQTAFTLYRDGRLQESVLSEATSQKR